MKRAISSAARYLLLAAIAAPLLACGIGDALVSGVANSGNRFYATPVIDDLAEQLASNEVVPPVSDAMLRDAFEAIAARAGEGDPDAALILYRLAAEQRKLQEK